MVSDRKVLRRGWEWGKLGLIQWKMLWWDAKVKREFGVGVHGDGLTVRDKLEKGTKFSRQSNGKGRERSERRSMEGAPATGSPCSEEKGRTGCRVGNWTVWATEQGREFRD